MSRLFDGVDDVMRYALPASGPPQWTYGTLLVVAKIATTSDSTWLSLIEGENSGGAVAYALGRRNNGQLYMTSGGALASAVTIEDADGWALYAATKATGSAVPTSHKVILSSGTRTSTAQDTALANTGGTLSGNIKIGGDDDPANTYLGVTCVMPSIVLSTTQIDGIASAKTTASILALCDANSWLADDSDSFATDLNGTVDRSSITGTTDSADDPSGWVYGVGGTAPVSATRALAYDIENLVSATRALAYDILATSSPVSATRALAYNLLNAATATRALAYDIEASIAATRALGYDIKNTVAAQRALAYDIKNLVSATRALAYDVENLVSASRALGYDLSPRAAATRALAYDILDASGSTGALYNALMGVGR